MKNEKWKIKINSSNNKYNLNIVDDYNNYETILNYRFFYFLNLFSHKFVTYIHSLLSTPNE